MLKWRIKPPRPLYYDGERIWETGDWFSAPLYPGPRFFIVMRPSDAPFPDFLNSKGYCIPASSRLRNVVHDYLQVCREDGVGKDEVLDCRAGVYRGKDYPTVDFVELGNHLGPNTQFFVDDIYSLSVFRAGEGTKTFSDRRKRLGKVVRGISSPFLRINAYTRIESKKQFKLMRRLAKHERGFDLILRRDAPYQNGRSGNVLIVPAE